MHAGVLGQWADHPHVPSQGGFEQRRVVVVGSGGDQVQRDAPIIAGHRAFGALFAVVDRAAPSDLAPPRDLLIDPSTERSSSSRPMIWSQMAQRGLQHRLAGPELGPQLPCH